MVYVTQEQNGKNITGATRYGEITILAKKSDQIIHNDIELVSNIIAKLQFFDDYDYILLLGDPIIIGIAVAIAASINEGRVSMLKWDRQEKRYFPVNININSGEINGNE